MGHLDTLILVVVPSQETVLETWTVRKLSLFASIMPVYLVLVGSVFIVLGSVQAIRGPRPDVGFFTWMAFVGVFGLALGVMHWLYTARRVELLSDGRFRFVAARRRICVNPEQLQSASGLGYFLDFWGSLPFLVRTSIGSILVDRHMQNAGELQQRLCLASPNFQVKRAWSSSGADGGSRPEVLHRFMG